MDNYVIYQFTHNVMIIFYSFALIEFLYMNDLLCTVNRLRLRSSEG